MNYPLWESCWIRSLQMEREARGEEDDMVENTDTDVAMPILVGGLVICMFVLMGCLCAALALGVFVGWGWFFVAMATTFFALIPFMRRSIRRAAAETKKDTG